MYTSPNTHPINSKFVPAIENLTAQAEHYHKHEGLEDEASDARTHAVG